MVVVERVADCGESDNEEDECIYMLI